MNHSENSVSLVLGSGGARGFAHIGVIRWLEKHNYPIKSIAGSSVGALVGGAYAAGKLDAFEQWALELNAVNMASLLDFSWRNDGFFKGDKMMDALRDLIGEIRIEDLPMTFTAVTTNIATEKEVWLNSGSLFDAIRASISLPFFFTPVKDQQNVYIDGGVINPVPVAPTLHDDTALTIAVNLGGLPQRRYTQSDHNDNTAPDTQGGDQSPSAWQQLQRQIKTLFHDDSDDEAPNWNIYHIADKAFDTMQSAIAKQKLAAYPPDIEIEIPRDICATFEFTHAEALIQLGYDKTDAAFNQQRPNLS